MGWGEGLKRILTTFDKIPPLGGWVGHTRGEGLKWILDTFDKISPLGGWVGHTWGGFKNEFINL